jgi:Ca2+-binding RTX toxin-like protein
MKRRFSNLSIESLERRNLMAADITLSDGLLHVQGTQNNDVIEIKHVQLRSGPEYINVKVTPQFGSPLQESFSPSLIDSILVECFGGNDVAENRTSKPSEMYGGRGGDILTGGTSHDVIYTSEAFGDVGDTGGALDQAFGRAGQDTLIGYFGPDWLDGGAGDDYLYGFYSNDQLFGGSGKDHLFGEYGTDWLYGGVEDDFLYGGWDNDVLYGEDGNDHLYAYDGISETFESTGTNWLYGGAGHDKLFGAASIDYCYGEAGNDEIFAGNGDDYLDGGLDNDTLYGRNGNDQVYGREGNDELHGDSGDDRCEGGVGDDFVAGGSGIDRLLGDQVLSPEDGDDQLVFDFIDADVDGVAGWARWVFCPTVLDGWYEGHHSYSG